MASDGSNSNLSLTLLSIGEAHLEAASDALVVGGGPCGCFTALNVARLGGKATVLEEHGEIGVPSHCAGHLNIEGLKRLGLYPLPSRIVEGIFRGAIFHSPNGKKFRVSYPQAVTCAVNRSLFDRYIAETAQKAGARLMLHSYVDSLISEEGAIKGVKTRIGDSVHNISTKVIVDAEGVSSRILRQTGLRMLDRNRLVNCVEAEVDGVKNVESEMVEVFLSETYFPGFYAWLIPKSDGGAKVGLGAKKGNPKKLFEKFMLKHPVASVKLRHARVLKTSYHTITLGGPISQTYSDGFIAVGDVASQVKPTTGGGVVWGLTCARIAAEVVSQALIADDCSKRFLGTYQKRWMRLLGFEARATLFMRNVLNSLSDRQIDQMIEFSSKVGLSTILQEFEDLDFQGRSSLRLLRSPRMLVTLAYFFIVTFLPANP